MERHLSGNVGIRDVLFDRVEFALYLPPNEGGILLVGKGLIEEIMAFQPVKVCTYKSS